jgi:hypothetical protein
MSDADRHTVATEGLHWLLELEMLEIGESLWLKNTPSNTPRPKPGCVGDVNGDGKVNMVDLLIAFKAMGTRPGQPCWNPHADVNGDLHVDLCDLLIVMKAMATGLCYRH